MRAGLFEHWQAEYAERRVSTFPVRPDKTPGVRGWGSIGSKASKQLAMSFADSTGIGLACKRNRITVLDVDTTDERVLADGLSRFGDTPFVVRSGSGHYQAWYRNNGEGRRIRPDPRVPIDILGDGFVVAPPSQALNGVYQIIRGSLDDLPNLPRMSAIVGQNVAIRDKSSPSLSVGDSERRSTILVGQGRNDDLFRQCLKLARTCKRLEELMDKAMEYNRGYPEPLSADEVLKVIASAWGYEVEGKNWVGYGPRVVFAVDEVDTIMDHQPDAFILLTKLRRHHWDRDFLIANAMADTMPGGGWRRQRLASARQYLLEANIIDEVRPASRQYGPAVYRFKSGQ